jgi:hypothetical protein
MAVAREVIENDEGVTQGKSPSDEFPPCRLSPNNDRRFLLFPFFVSLGLKMGEMAT